jgi:heme A synthase
MVHLHMAHRAFAFVVLGLVTWTSLRIARTSHGLQRALALCAPALVVVQIALGVLTILTFKDLVPLTAHLLVGALLLADQVALLSMTHRSGWSFGERSEPGREWGTRRPAEGAVGVLK